MPCAAVNIEPGGGESGLATAAGSSHPWHTFETPSESHVTARDWTHCYVISYSALQVCHTTLTCSHLLFSWNVAASLLATLAFLSWNARGWILLDDIVPSGKNH